MARTVFSNFIHNLRLSRNYSICDVSNALFIHRSTYYHYEKGDRIPSVEIILRISNLYRINPMELFYTLASEEVKKVNQTLVNYRYANMSMYTPEELQFLKEIAYLNAEQQGAVLNMVKLFSSSNSNKINI